ncbi:aspartate-semialdehyde dehydrogenase [Candidatus Micrarchaeota archaeon]|nr:aspartate-semialdehyde dehydrogenase [Candidatus Micrarchaeota archaeon]
MKKLSVAIVGATGVVGQQAINALLGHPQFEIVSLAASEKSAGKKYSDAIARGGVLGWHADGEMPAGIGGMAVSDASSLDPRDVDLVLSCIESDAARTLEPKFAEHCGVVSTASAFRRESDVPLVIPQVNPDDVGLIDSQREQRGWDGFITPIPNCTTTGLAITLKPLSGAFGLRSVVMTSMQAVSGAGRSPGVAALDITDNVIPFIAGEEEKVEAETRKILGLPSLAVSCTCTRVPVLEGHTETVFASFEKTPSPQEAAAAMSGFLPKYRTRSTPSRLIRVFEDASRPQPRLDRNEGNGLTTSVGRIRADPVLGLKYVLLSHNTKMGAAAGAVWLAELLELKGYLK